MTAEACPPGEIRGPTALLVWGLPILAIVVGNIVEELYLWLATPAFAIMGAACVVNAARCDCYATGPLLLAMAALLVLVAAGVAPAGWINEAGITLLAGIALAFAAEWITGRRYVGRTGRGGSGAPPRDTSAGSS